MLLAINANNTNTKFAIFDAGRIVGDWRCESNPRRTADEYVVWLNALMALEGIDPKGIDSIVIASVVPAAMFNLKLLCSRHYGKEPLVIGDPDCVIGINVLIDKPREVGADRLANAVGAQITYHEPSIVIDFGTATTFDVIGSNGDYLGGLIAPGINLNLEALHMATAKLPRIALEKPDRVIGKDTIGAMQAGVFWGYVALIEGLVARIQKEFGGPMMVISTGGLAPLFQGATEVIRHLDPDITMRGLLEIWRRNRTGA